MPLSCPPSRLRGLRFDEPRFFPVDENGLSSFPGVKPFVVFSFHLRRFFKAFLGGIEDVLRLITPLEIWNAVQGFSLVDYLRLKSFSFCLSAIGRRAGGGLPGFSSCLCVGAFMQTEHAERARAKIERRRRRVVFGNAQKAVVFQTCR